MLNRSMFLGTAAFLSSPEGNMTGANASPLRSASIVDAAEKAASELSEETETHLADFAAANEEKGAGAVIACLDLVEDFGDEVVNLPIPGSTAKDAGNHTPDKFTREVIVGGEKKNKPASFYSIMFDATKQGQILLATIAAIDASETGDEAKAENYFKFYPKGTPACRWDEYKAYDKEDRAGERGRVAQSRTNRRNVMVKGVRLAMKYAAVNAMPGCDVQFALDSEGNPKRQPKPVIISDKPWLPTSKRVLVSTDTFLSMDVNAALKAGGKLSDLQATVSREGSGGTPTAGKKSDVPEFTTAALLEQGVAALAAKLGTDAGKAEMLKLASGDHSKDVIISLCIIADALDSITTKGRHIYESWLEAQAVKKAAA